ncbi:nucleotide exchange factor GrpE [Streptoalloteichus hindustanus]|uniref:GrpE protein n=1 Tax=Streptoalloteichus hindustanus TaxID=2017 RepID=A0A1M4UT70_STRHI|nr:nucleotide exchange factor GrpE [Streptoalloteichus hindustanus]SHE59884.1 GrpE protein [Streptoalloteichus hindustanus]
MSAWFRRREDRREAVDGKAAENPTERVEGNAGENAGSAGNVGERNASPVRGVEREVRDMRRGEVVDGPTDQNELVNQALAERRALVRLCVYAWDRARSAGVAERIEEGLAGIGVAAVRPDGERFDPAHHEAGGTTPTDDPALDGVIAETEVVGFLDRGQLLRAPVVTVYRARTGS